MCQVMIFLIAPAVFHETEWVVEFQSESAVSNIMSNLNKDVRFQKRHVFG